MSLQLIIDTSVAQVWPSLVVPDNRSLSLMNDRTIAITIMARFNNTSWVIEFIGESM